MESQFVFDSLGGEGLTWDAIFSFNLLDAGRLLDGSLLLGYNDYIQAIDRLCYYSVDI